VRFGFTNKITSCKREESKCKHEVLNSRSEGQRYVDSAQFSMTQCIMYVFFCTYVAEAKAGNSWTEKNACLGLSQDLTKSASRNMSEKASKAPRKYRQTKLSYRKGN